MIKMQGMTLFTGFDGAGLGMRAAGIDVVAGIEYDPAIAEVARANGVPVTTVDVLTVNPADYIGIQALHASPPCPNFSVAKTGRGETVHDIDLAQAVARFVEALQPQVFTLENVYAYRQSKSWRLISNTLDRLGYWWDLQHVNAADYGVAQTRQRMIVRAVYGAMVPQLPEPERWRGWYEAIEDLIPTLPESQFAPWQMERLPAELKTFLVGGSNTNFNDAREGRGVFDTEEPAPTVPSDISPSRYRAFIMQGGNDSTRPILDYEPVSTIGSVNRVGNIPRAFLVDGKLSSSGSEKVLQINKSDQPSGTVVSSHSAFRDARAWLSHGKTVKMTPRALARFQSFPDSYVLPDSAALACRGIGNAVPPLLMQKVWTPLREAIA